MLTIAGNGNYNCCGNGDGDGGPALSASLRYPRAVAIDLFGNIAISDTNIDVVRLLTPIYSFCTFSLSASSITLASAGGSTTPTVTTTAGCVWNAFTSASWITLTPNSGNGSGNAGLQIAANNTGASRTAIVNIAGQTFTVTQQTQPSVFIESPVPNAAVSGTIQVSGWAIDNVSTVGTAIASAQVLVDGVVSGTATYGANRTDVCTAYPGRLGCPNVGFTYSLNAGLLTPGPHTVTVNATNSSSPVSTGVASVGINVVSVPAAVSVTPNSATGVNQVFTAVYSDSGGTALLNRRFFLINSSLNGAGACYVQVDTTGISLVNDAGNGVTGPLIGSNALTNNQCTLNGAGSSVGNSGNNSTLTLSLTFKPTFAGAKNIYMYADDSTNNSGWQTRGTFTVGSAPPTVTSVSPSSASGYSQTFTAAYSDPSGAAYLNRRLLLINSTLNGAGACFVQTDPTGIYLINDAGSGLLGPVTGAATVTNSQCTLNGTGTGVTNTNGVSTVTAALTFKASFAGAKTLYAYTDDSFGNNSGFQTTGTYTVAFGAPTADSVTPSSASGATQTFTAIYSDPAGATALNRRLFLVNSSLNGAGACFVQTDTTGIYLVNDAGSALLGPITGGSILSNNQCILNGAGTGAVNSGNSSTVTLSLTFKAAFAGAKNIYMHADDSFGGASGWQTRGTYAVSSVAPTADSVTPNTGSAANQTFTAVYSDAAGAAALKRRLFLIASSLNGAGACFVQMDPTGIYLVNDAGSALLGPLASGTLSNGQCTLNSSGTSVTPSGNSSTAVLSLAFPNSLAGVKNIYMYADDANGNSGWQTRGTFTVPGVASTPSPVSVTPSSGSGSTQTFTAVFTDPAGNSLLNRRLLLINSSLNGAGACFVQVDNAGISLATDAGNGLTGPLTPSGTLTNSQCTVNGSGSSSVSYSATDTTVVLSISFKPAFAGTKTLFMYADDTGTNNSGWLTKGTWTAQ